MKQLLTLIFSLSLCYGHAQDSRYQDSLRADRLSLRAYHLKDSKPDSSFYYAKQALKLAREHKFLQIQAYSLSDIGVYCKEEGSFKQSRKYLFESLEIRKSISDSGDIASIYNNIGMLYDRMEEFDSAKIFYEKGLGIAQRIQHYSHQNSLLFNLSTNYMNKGEYDKSADMLLRSLDIAMQQNDSAKIARRYQNLGNLYLKMKRFELALEYYGKAENLYSAISYQVSLIDVLINKAAVYQLMNNPKASLEIINDTKNLIEERKVDVELYNNLGRVYQIMGKLELAEDAFQKAADEAQLKGKNRSFATATMNWLNVKILRKDLNGYETLLQKTEEVIIDDSLYSIWPTYYKLKSSLYEQDGDYEKAFKALGNYDNYLNRLNLKVDQAQKLTTEHQRLKIEQKILIKDKELEAGENAQLRILIIAIIGFSFAIIILLFFRFRTAKLKTQSALEKKKSEDELLHVLNKIDVQILEKQMEAKEAASIQIGQNLHDNLGSKLAVVQMSFDGVRSKIGDLEKTVAGRMDQIEKLLEESCEDMRGIAHDLMDKNLKSRGLEKELKQYLEVIDGVKGMKTRYIPVNVPNSLPASIQTEVIAIIRLLIENVLRHAQATEVSIYLKGEQNSLQIIVEDNGCGFELDKVTDQDGRGIQNAQQRSEKINAQFSIDSQPGRGTLAKLDILLNNN